MNYLDNFWVDSDNCIRLNTRVIVVRDYKTTEKKEYDDTTYYLHDRDYKEWTEQLIPQHQLLELLSDDELDTSEYTWLDGIKLRTGEYAKEIAEIAAYGSLEAYQASLSEAQDEYMLDLDSRISALELGI